MFKKFFVFTLICVALIYGCRKEQEVQPTASNGGSNSVNNGYRARGTASELDSYSASIPVDTANRMIQSYLYSVNYPATDVSLRSLSINADTLRGYLKDPNVKTIKLMLAHQPAYINSGHFGEFAGMNPAALTVVLVGVGTSGTFILNKQNEVYEHFSPCPVLCDGATSAYIQ